MTYSIEVVRSSDGCEFLHLGLSKSGCMLIGRVKLVKTVEILFNICFSNKLLNDRFCRLQLPLWMAVSESMVILEPRLENIVSPSQDG